MPRVSCKPGRGFALALVGALLFSILLIAVVLVRFSVQHDRDVPEMARPARPAPAVPVPHDEITVSWRPAATMRARPLASPSGTEWVGAVPAHRTASVIVPPPSEPQTTPPALADPDRPEAASHRDDSAGVAPGPPKEIRLPASLSLDPFGGAGARSATRVARVEGVRGRVYALSDSGIPSAVREGQSLVAGQGILTSGGGSGAVIRYDDGTSLSLAPETSVTLIDFSATPPEGSRTYGKGVFICEGSLSAEVARQASRRPMLVGTPRAQVEVLGTFLNLDVSPAATRIEVLEGKVLVTRRADSVCALVGAGQWALAADGVSLDPRPLSNDGLLLWLPLDEETGSVAFDASGNTLPLRRYGGSWRPRMGRIGGAIDLDGKRDYLWCRDYPKATHRMTCLAWVCARTRSRWGTIVKNWANSEASHGQIHFGLHDLDGDLECGITEADGGEVRLRERKPFPLNAWQHVAVVADGGFVRLYRNGTVVAEAPYDGTLKADFKPLGVGVKPNDEGTAPTVDGTSGYWDGLIDDVRIYRRAMSGREVHNLSRLAR